MKKGIWLIIKCCILHTRTTRSSVVSEVSMTVQETVISIGNDPEQLEQLYQTAVTTGQAEAFREAIDAGRAAAPDNLLYAAWYYRLQARAVKARESFTAWGWAIPLALLNGLLLWALSDDSRFALTYAGARPGLPGNFLPSSFPLIALLAAPISAVFVIAYLSLAGRKRRQQASIISLVLLAATAYVAGIYPRLGSRPYQEQYLTLMIAHLALLAWAGVGAYLIFSRGDADHNPSVSTSNTFAFLNKSLELFIMAGLFAIAGGIFTGITVGLFDALGITLSDNILRMIVAGGGGMLPIIATAILYNPRVAPAGQEFEGGLSGLVAMLTRVMLPLTVLVLLIYLAFIPFNFREPFENRDVLIIYNAMLFAVIALMVGATPVISAHVSPRVGVWLRQGIILLAALAAVISVYALAAILYRTAMDRLTPNRLTFIGWNIINIGLLLLLLYRQARAKGNWLVGLHHAFATGAAAYAVWALAVIVALPWLFGIDQTNIESLPPSVQAIIYEQSAPILLKCFDSPHIYLLEDGTKRWIDTITTFTDRGYVWRDVSFIPCDDLRAIPDGVPIPKSAGPPPQP